MDFSKNHINIDRTCSEDSFLGLNFKHNFQKYFAFHNYKTLVEEGSIPDLVSSYLNGSLCFDYVRKYVAFVDVNSPSSQIILTKR